MTTPPGPDQFAGNSDYDTVMVQLTPEEARSGTVRTVFVPPGERTAAVQIPPGVADNMAFRLPGAGAPGPAGGPPRDLVVVIRIVAPTTMPFHPAAPFGTGAAPMPPPATTNRRRRTMLLVGAGLAVVLLAGCCGVSVLMFARDDDPEPRGVSGTPRPSASAPGPAAPVEVSAAQYQQELTAVDKSLSGALATLKAARNPKAIRTAAGSFATAARTGGTELAALTPPATAATGHDSLLTALEDLASAVEETASAAEERQVCAGGSATALFSRSPAVDRMRDAAAQLAAADPAQAYKIGTFLTGDIKDTARRMGNGTYVKRTRGGSGLLKITNGESVDKVISLVPTSGKKPATTVYVRGKSKHSVNGIRDGTYRIYLTAGVDWDAGQRRFTRNCRFAQFDDTMKFTTTSRQYTIWEITLKPTVGGNASTTDVDPDAFPE